MTFVASNLIASSGSEVEWSRTLMIAWLFIALSLSIIEVFWLAGGFSSQKLSPERFESEGELFRDRVDDSTFR